MLIRKFIQRQYHLSIDHFSYLGIGAAQSDQVGQGIGSDHGVELLRLVTCGDDQLHIDAGILYVLFRGFRALPFSREPGIVHVPLQGDRLVGMLLPARLGVGHVCRAGFRPFLGYGGRSRGTAL